MKSKKIYRIVLTLLITGILMMGISIWGVFQAKVKAEEIAGKIIIGDDDEMTGPYAATTYCHVQAAQDYWKQHNYRIKVNGKIYKIKHLLVDNKCDVSVSVSNFHRFVSEGAVVVRTNWTPGMIALKPLACLLYTSPSPRD